MLDNWYMSIHTPTVSTNLNYLKLKKKKVIKKFKGISIGYNGQNKIEMASMIFPSYIPQVDLTLMIKAIFLSVAINSDVRVYHINNPTWLVFPWVLIFSCFLVLTGDKVEVDLRLNVWLNKQGTHESNPTDQDSDPLSLIVISQILSQKDEVYWILFLKSIKSEMRYLGCLSFLGSSTLSHWEDLPMSEIKVFILLDHDSQ